MKAKPQPKQPKDNDISLPQEDRGMWPEDKLLRDHKYSIHSRPNKGEAVWKWREWLFPHSVALRRVKSHAELE